jgi:predicted Zn-dependent protease
MALQKILSILGFLFFSSISSAQPVSNHLYFQSLPYPPKSFSGFQPALQKQLYFEAQRVSQSFAPLHIRAELECPRTSQWIRRVFNRLLGANSLDHFFSSQNRNVELVILCPNGNGAVASSTADTVLISAAFVKNFMSTEDEVAFLLGHELAHVLAGGHLEFVARNRPPNRYESQKAESQADENGLVLAAKAGYDPLTSINFMKRLSRAMPEEGAWAETSHPPVVLR